MKLLLTPELLTFLSEEGFRYGYSRTTLARAGTHAVDVTLTPVFNKSAAADLPEQYDTCYELTEEPAEMARHTNDALIFVELDKETIARYFKVVLQPRNSSGNTLAIRFIGKTQAHSTGLV